ncbi:unnamed protein product (macronuclear) [Paramecium tetraurelia]|uniref:Uncharacterized protein n=1 Tax=Paramecium tetraurelia TaxID=5888 RepID=A0CRI4_PARTE|nr:uncharacterized protein GSPATT00009716001 [Paramecium tetraurelia]CAK73401.1 unnamed protein product [Paramecium tetraurelia]|eukprot:XP_001440798.1 hypothetical protein (macronuclear) [Paramecium tetraurelia strain d4-2]
MKVFAIMALLLITAYSQSNEIDVVLKMLGDLKNGTIKQLQELESDWEATKYQKQDIVNDLQRVNAIEEIKNGQIKSVTLEQHLAILIGLRRESKRIMKDFKDWM